MKTGVSQGSMSQSRQGTPSVTATCLVSIVLFPAQSPYVCMYIVNWTIKSIEIEYCEQVRQILEKTQVLSTNWNLIDTPIFKLSSQKSEEDLENVGL